MAKKKQLPKICWQCGRNGAADPLDRHHVFGGANRANSEVYGATVHLCHFRCHEFGDEAVHKSARRALALKQWMQRVLMARQGWSVEDFRAVFGKSWI